MYYHTKYINNNSKNYKLIIYNNNNQKKEMKRYILLISLILINTIAPPPENCNPNERLIPYSRYQRICNENEYFNYITSVCDKCEEDEVYDEIESSWLIEYK